MAEQKEEKTSDLNACIQYPSIRSAPPPPTPKPIHHSLPKTEIPNETLLVFDDSDWVMFRKIHQKYGDRLKGLYPDDTTRFVQGYSHEKERDLETFKRIDELLKRGFMSSKYPQQYDFHTILDTSMPNNEEEESQTAWPLFLYGYDKEGHPILYDEIGCSNPADLDVCFEGKMRKLKTFRFRVLRRLHNTKRIQNMRYGYDGSVNSKGGFNAITKHCIVMDIKNFYAKSLTAKYRNLVRDIIADESNLWPNTLEKMYIINAPWPFRFAWRIIQNFIHPITVKKISILGSDYLTEMTQKIDINQIPKAYGGKGTLAIKRGYVADIENDIIDGDYCSVCDPIDLKTVPCIKNRDNLNKRKNDDEKEEDDNKDEKEKVDSKNASDDLYIKVQGDDKRNLNEKK